MLRASHCCWLPWVWGGGLKRRPVGTIVALVESSAMALVRHGRHERGQQVEHGHDHSEQLFH
jgi:hypothetical protein